MSETINSSAENVWSGIKKIEEHAVTKKRVEDIYVGSDDWKLILLVDSKLIVKKRTTENFLGWYKKSSLL